MAYRKLFVDSRFRNSGYHNDFTLEFADDILTSRTASVFLASASFPNCFESINDYNDYFYYFTQRGATKTKLVTVAESGAKTVLTKVLLSDESVVSRTTEVSTPTVLPERWTNTILDKLTSTSSVGEVTSEEYGSLEAGEKTLSVEVTGDVKTTRETAVGATGTVLAWTTTVRTKLTAPDPPLSIVTSFAPMLDEAGQPVLDEAGDPVYSTDAVVTTVEAEGDPIIYVTVTTDELTGEVTTASYTAAEGAEAFDAVVAMSSVVTTVVTDVATYVTTKVTNALGQWTTYTVETYEHIAAGDAVTVTTTNDVTEESTTVVKTASADLAEFEALADGTTTEAIVVVIPGAMALSHRNYSGASLAAEMVTQLSNLVDFTPPTITFDATTGQLTFTCANDTHEMRIPSGTEVRDPDWMKSVWVGLYGGVAYNVTAPRDFNSQMNLPTYSNFYLVTTSGSIDLAPLREVYLHSNLTNFRTMTSNGAKDCIARIPVDVGYGEVVSYRHFGTDSDAIPCNELAFRNVRFSLRDVYGRVVPLDSYIVLELCFTETLPTM